MKFKKRKKDGKKEIDEFCDICQSKKKKKNSTEELEICKTARDKAEQLAGLALLLNKEEVMKLQGVCLGDQLKLFKNAGAPNLVNCASPTIADKKREALSEVVDLYLNSKWKIGEDGSSDSDNGDDEEQLPDRHGW